MMFMQLSKKIKWMNTIYKKIFIVFFTKSLLFFWIKSILTKNIKIWMQFFRTLHINQQLHIIFIYLIKIVKQNERISTLQKWQKLIHYRNNFEFSKISSLSNLCQTINWNVCEKISFNSFSFVQLFRILHFNQQSHMIFIYLIKIVKQNERILTLQK